MGGDWRETFLGSSKIAIFDGDRGKNYPKKSEFTSVGHCLFLNTGNVTQDGFNFASPEFVSLRRDNLLGKGKLRRNDIVLTTRGTVGNIGHYSSNVEYEHIRINSGMVILRSDCDHVLPRYVFMFLRSRLFRSQVHALTSGSAQPQLPIRDLKRVRISVPSLAYQRAVVNILGTLDDKIELNRQTNETLEAMAQAMFKSWFVDFDPVIDNALAAGNDIPEPFQARAAARQALGDARKPLPEEIRCEFPDEFVFSDEMGWVPRGWVVRNITDLVDTISETYDFDGLDKIIFLNTGDVLDGHILKNEYTDTVGLPGQAKKSIKQGDILYSEIRPKNRRFAFVDIEASDYVVSTKLMVLRAKKNIDPLFPYFILKQDNCVKRLQHIAESRSGTFPQITYTQLEEICIATAPRDDLVRAFSKMILKGSHDKSALLKQSSNQLSLLRDTLLPKLLSGQLTVPKAEKLVAEIL